MMKKIAIIGGGIIGATTAYYLDQQQYDITLFDSPIGQATKASAGIISPWLSKRRNKKWYALAKDGAAFYQKLQQDLQLDTTIYQQSGALILRPEHALDELAELAQTRKADAPEIGEIQRLSGQQTQAKVPIMQAVPSLFISGGAKLDGYNYLDYLKNKLMTRGVSFVNEYVTFTKKQGTWYVKTLEQTQAFDFLIVTPGPHLKKLLRLLNLQVDIRPQKGQLLAFTTPYQTSYDWPVVMLDGEADLIPFQKGKILLGATHENEAGWDLTPTTEAFQQLTESTRKFLKEELHFQEFPYQTQVGTRAYTSDFSPFFGPLPQDPTIVVASGLGSTGLTVGPFIGYQLANYFTDFHWPISPYQKPLATYIQPLHS